MKKSISQKTKEARILVEKLQDILVSREALSWYEAEIWYTLKKDSLYKFAFGDSGQDGSNKRSWASFVKELGVPLSTVDHRVACYEFWVEKYKIPIKTLQQYNARKLHRAIKYIEEGKQTVIDVLEQAKVLPFDQFIIWLNGNVEPCHHPRDKRKKESKEVTVCTECNKEIHGNHIKPSDLQGR